MLSNNKFFYDISFIVLIVGWGQISRQFPKSQKRVVMPELTWKQWDQPALGLTRFFGRENKGKAGITFEDLSCFLQGSS